MEREERDRRESHQMPFFVQSTGLASAIEKVNTTYRGRVKEGEVRRKGGWG